MIRPNVILITPDQFHADALSVAGHSTVRTPHLDQLANDGTRFSNCHVHNWVCTPSRATLVTGAHPSVHGAVFNDMQADTRLATVAGLLGEVGYSTGHVGKWHLLPAGVDFGFQHRHGHDGYPDYLRSVGIDPDLASEHGPDWARDNATWVSPIPAQHYITTWETDRAIDFIDQSAKDPFFLWLSYEKPHLPYNPPAGWAEMYDPSTISLPVTWNDPHDAGMIAKTHDAASHWRTGMSTSSMSDDEIRRTIAHYYGSVSLIDYNIGVLRNHLESSGLSTNTLVVFTSDHGEMLGEHRLLNKGPYPFESLTRVPAIILDPRRAGGEVVNGIVGQESLLTTILAAVGVPVPRTMRGVDLFGGERLSADGVSGLHFGPHYEVSVRTWRAGDFRYSIYGYADGRTEEELFDLRSDAHESRNLVTESERASDLNRMRAALLADIVLRDHNRPEVIEIAARFADQYLRKGFL